jgi:hypothetical protein
MKSNSPHLAGLEEAGAFFDASGAGAHSRSAMVNQAEIDALYETVPAVVKECHGQLSMDDRLIYYWAARHFYTGIGTIVDAGVLVGGTTSIFGEGLLQNPKAAGIDRPIQVYDLFTDDCDGYSAQFIKGLYSDQSNRDPIYDFEPHFRRNTQKYEKLLTAFKGDITKIGYRDPRDIEILSIDVAKTPALMHYIAREFFPRLSPRHAMVMHQDYIFSFQPWLLIAMEKMADLFVKVYDCPAQVTSLFVPRRPITERDVVERLGETPDGYYTLENAKYIYQAIDKAATPLAKLYTTAALSYFYFVKGREQTSKYIAGRMIDEFQLSAAFIERTELKLLLKDHLHMDYGAPVTAASEMGAVVSGLRARWRQYNK